MRRLGIVAVGLALLVVTACGGASDPSADRRHEIAETIGGYTEALLNADARSLQSYWSETCSEEWRRSIEDAFASGPSPARNDITVDEDALEIEVRGSDLVAVLLNPHKVPLHLTVDGEPQPGFFTAGPDVVHLLRREAGAWRIACK